MTNTSLRYQLVRIMKKFFYPKEKIDELLTDKSTIQINKSQVTDFPSNLQPASHTHTKSEISDFPSTMTPSAHTHTRNQITDFNHTHTKSEISDFPSTMTPSAHTHTKNQITDFPGNASSSSDGLMSSSDKTKFDALSYDSGWVNVPIDSYWKSSQTLRARRIGDIVFIQGSVEPKSGGYVMTGYDNTWEIAYLPEQFRPSRQLTSAQKGNTKKFYALYVKADGEMSIGRFADQGGSGDYELPANLYLSITLMYFI